MTQTYFIFYNEVMVLGGNKPLQVIELKQPINVAGVEYTHKIFGVKGFPYWLLLRYVKGRKQIYNPDTGKANFLKE